MAAVSDGDTKRLKQEVQVAWSRLKFRHTHKHILAFAVMVVITVLGSTTFSTIDMETLKPGPTFPLWLKQIAYWTNIPVKAGLVHLILYSVEWGLGDMDAFDMHVGQRMTTLWFQFLQHPRWGQHLHMQYETLLQVLDLLCGSIPKNDRSASGQRDEFTTMYGKGAIYAFLCVVASIMAIQNFITSCAYHTFWEQMAGLLLSSVKLLVDLSNSGSMANQHVGSCVNSASNMVVGTIFVLFGVLALGISNPALHASLLYLGCYMNHRLSLLPQMDMRTSYQNVKGVVLRT